MLVLPQLVQVTAPQLLKLPKEGLEKEEIQDEFIKQENKETIV